MNPDPYLGCDPEIDIDKAQEEEDQDYFDEDDLGGGRDLCSYLFLFIMLFIIDLFFCRQKT